ncbi:MAG: hypothetical protein LBG16_01770 [Elusimicrobiota bacterium]|jgi:hypothetical protein|nr:hypothetical protein [Elusimicrobiota bacterium]
MKYSLLFCLSLILIFAACAAGNKNYKHYQGIDYEQYNQDKKYNDAVLSGFDGGAVDQVNMDAPSFSIDYDAVGNEIIESTGSNYGEAAVVMAAKKIFLSRDAGQQDIGLFQQALDAAYKTVIKEYRPAGFTYAMSPAGAVNPLSIMDVQCILSEGSANSAGKAACDLFFEGIAEQYQKLKYWTD